MQVLRFASYLFVAPKGGRNDAEGSLRMTLSELS
jgi:hypothetical protein